MKNRNISTKTFINLILCALLIWGLEGCKSEVHPMAVLNPYDNVSTETWDLPYAPQKNFPWDIVEDKNGSIWLATISGLMKYHEGKWTIFAKEDGLQSSQIDELEYDETFDLIYYTHSDFPGIFTFDITTEKSSFFMEPSKWASSIEIDNNGYLWCKSRNYLFKINVITGEEENIEYHNSTDQAYTIGPFKLDNTNLPWFEMREWHSSLGIMGGHYEIQGLKSNINNVYEYMDIDLGYSEFVRCIFFDSKNNVWVGTSERIHCYNGETWRVETMNGVNLGANAITEDNFGNIIMGCDYLGLVVYRNGSFQKLNSGLTNDRFSFLFKDSKGSIWIGGMEEVVKMDFIF